jgi:uncharacterized protein YcfL
MKQAATATLIFIVIAGCSVPRGGKGETTDGNPIIATANVTVTDVEIELVDLSGMDCTGKYSKIANSAQTSRKVKFPLRCTDGRTGNAIVSASDDTLRGEGIFKLSDDTEGTFELGTL